MLAITAGARKGAGITKARVHFGSEADMCSAQADVRFVPIADIDEPSKALAPWLKVGAAR